MPSLPALLEIQRTYITFKIRVSHNVDIIFRRANIGSSNIKLAHGKRRFAATILTFRSALLSGVTKKFYHAVTCLSCSRTAPILFSSNFPSPLGGARADELTLRPRYYRPRSTVVYQRENGLLSCPPRACTVQKAAAGRKKRHRRRAVTNR